ncbi:amino acid--tRNA ligase-related protein [Nocardia sp. BMG51109]|uniref:amino acid--tRNA ligase-related protein n=1 Tax=Nocardia sp. BMG51109 TaxID=1056816 RepID=UPI000467A24B|nr:amino acid--tRNA ligase-related protein [Nocardia sp. BMG51109]
MLDNDTITVKSELLWSLHNMLHDEGFKELVTPTFRRADDLTGNRPTATVGAPGYLRSMIGPALRYNLQYTPRIYEIGPCFRTDIPDATHNREFSMLDLYAADEDYTYLLDLAERMVRLAYSGDIVHLSVADHVWTTLGIDLKNEPLESHVLADHLAMPAETPLPALLDAYLHSEIEPLTLGCATFLVDLPLGGNEPCARRRPDTVAVLNRFEVFIDGIEVIHGYEDETNTHEFLTRASAIDLYNAEQHLVQQAILAGTVPAASVGLGIGIERLCMAASGIRDIHRFLHSACF